MKHTLLILFYLLIAVAGFAQNITISGTVTDEKNAPVSGANITIKGKVTGTITDANGSFAIHTSATPPLTLIVSMIGFQRQEIAVDNTSSLQVKLIEASQAINEVVITASRVEENILTSPVSIEKMNARDIQQTPSVSFYDALETSKVSRW